MSATHTYAILEVSAETHHEIRKALMAAGYAHALHDEGDRTVIDMHGLALAGRPPATQAIQVGSILNAQGRGKVELTIDGRIVSQFDVAKAREIGLMLLEASEAAISDQATATWLQDKLGLESGEAMGRILLDLREIRQGTRQAVYPS